MELTILLESLLTSDVAPVPTALSQQLATLPLLCKGETHSFPASRLSQLSRSAALALPLRGAGRRVLAALLVEGSAPQTEDTSKTPTAQKQAASLPASQQAPAGSQAASAQLRRLADILGLVLFADTAQAEFMTRCTTAAAHLVSQCSVEGLAGALITSVQQLLQARLLLSNVMPLLLVVPQAEAEEMLAAPGSTGEQAASGSFAAAAAATAVPAAGIAFVALHGNEADGDESLTEDASRSGRQLPYSALPAPLLSPGHAHAVSASRMAPFVLAAGERADPAFPKPGNGAAADAGKAARVRACRLRLGNTLLNAACRYGVGAVVPNVSHVPVPELRIRQRDLRAPNRTSPLPCRERHVARGANVRGASAVLLAHRGSGDKPSVPTGCNSEVRRSVLQARRRLAMGQVHVMRRLVSRMLSRMPTFGRARCAALLAAGVPTHRRVAHACGPAWAPPLSIRGQGPNGSVACGRPESGRGFGSVHCCCRCSPPSPAPPAAPLTRALAYAASQTVTVALPDLAAALLGEEVMTYRDVRLHLRLAGARAPVVGSQAGGLPSGSAARIRSAATGSLVLWAETPCEAQPTQLEAACATSIDKSGCPGCGQPYVLHALRHSTCCLVSDM